MSYFILGLPRSRTTWLAAYLNCYHEKSIEFPTLSKLAEFVKQEDCGISDTALIVHYKWLLENLDSKVVVIHRDWDEVLSSCAELFGDCSQSKMLLQSRECLKELRDIPQVLNVEFNSIDKNLKDICEFINVPYNRDRHREFAEMQIQPHNQKLLQRVTENWRNYQSLYGKWL